MNITIDCDPQAFLTSIAFALEALDVHIRVLLDNPEIDAETVDHAVENLTGCIGYLSDVYNQGYLIVNGEPA